MAWHAFSVLSTATLFFNFLGSKVGEKKSKVCLIHSRYTPAPQSKAKNKNNKKNNAVGVEKKLPTTS